MIITIDGHAGAGKTTAAQQLADALGFELLNTGAMYRAAAWALAEAGVDIHADPADELALAAVAESLTFDLSGGRVVVDDRDVTDVVFTEECGRAASKAGTFRAVRRRLQAEQRRLADDRDVVAEGRDQGTVVFPAAPVKFFVTAAAGHRARRRAEQLGLPCDPAALAELEAHIAARDAQDAGRELDPLRVPAGAVVVDTSELGPAAVLVLMRDAVERWRRG